MAMPLYILGATGVTLLVFPDTVVQHTPLRIFVFSCLMVVYVMSLLARRAVLNPLSSAGTSIVVSGIVYLASVFGATENLTILDQSAVIAAVLCMLFSTLAAVYFDSVLERKLQRFVVLCTGVAACVIAVTLDYPAFDVLIHEAAFCGALAALRYWISRQPPNRGVPPKTPDAVVEVESSEDVALEPHPLVLRGMIVNPKTDKIIMIGKKTYEGLVQEGYKPDFTRGVLVKSRSQ